MKLTDGQVSGYEVLLLVDVRDVAASVCLLADHRHAIGVLAPDPLGL